MEVKRLQNMFIHMLRCALNETELDTVTKAALTPDAIAALFALSKKHDLAHIVSTVLYKNGLTADERTMSLYSREEMLSIYRHEQMKHVYGQVCHILEENAIPYIPLKGAVLRPYYPQESMRTSCDIDILVHEEDLHTAIDALVQEGFRCEEKSYHDVSLYSKNKIHLELHFNIQENREKLDGLLKNAWDYAATIEGSQYAFTKEFFFFHMLAHMSYHFMSGGCGIRSLMDVWVMQHKMGMSYQDAKSLLEEAGIAIFAEKIALLSEACFSGEKPDAFLEEMLSYIMNGGVYGTTENHIAIEGAEGKTTLSYTLKRVFISYKDMAVEYPVLKRAPILLPFCWLHRTGKLFFRFIKRLFTHKKVARDISDERMEKSQSMRRRLGL